MSLIVHSAVFAIACLFVLYVIEHDLTARVEEVVFIFGLDNDTAVIVDEAVKTVLADDRKLAVHLIDLIEVGIYLAAVKDDDILGGDTRLNEPRIVHDLVIHEHLFIGVIHFGDIILIGSLTMFAGEGTSCEGQHCRRDERKQSPKCFDLMFY